MLRILESNFLTVLIFLIALGDASAPTVVEGIREHLSPNLAVFSVSINSNSTYQSDLQAIM